MPDPLRDDSPLDAARKRLYRRQSVDGVSRSASATAPAPAPVPAPRPAEGWREEVPAAVPARHMSVSFLFLTAATGFFVVAGIIAAAVLFLGGRSVSADQLRILVEAPANVGSGQEISLLITVRNDNPVAATGATLSVTFPEGTKDLESGADLTYVQETFERIPAGASARTTVRAAFFGEEGQRIQMPMNVEYRTENSNATFIARETQEILIATAPLSLSVEALSELAPGETLPLRIVVRSNATRPLENVAVRAFYPFGFTLAEAAPEPANGLFVLGTLAPGEEHEIRIRGTLVGQEGEERVFRFAAGTLGSADARELAASYVTREAPVTITRPFLSVNLSVNRSDSNVIVMKAGEAGSAIVSWKNELASSIADGRIVLKLEGDALDPASVKAVNGFYRSSDRTVVFDRETERGLSSLAPGASGNGSFTFSTRPSSALSGIRNPSIALSASVSGRRSGQGNVPESVSSVAVRTIRIETDLSLAASAVRTEGPFTNSGPWPPAVDQETTYTILLSATNSANTVANAAARVALPSYVRFTGQANPSSAIRYDEATREVSWTIGDMAPGASASAAFQVALLPSVSQRGTSPALTSAFRISGFDRFIERDTAGEASAVTTRTTSDPDYQEGLGNVR